MKKQSLLILFVSMLFLGVSVTSCKKSDDPKKDDEEQNDDDIDPTLSTYLQGSDYYLITLDETSKTNIQSRVNKDYRTDDITKFLYIWDGTYGPGTSSGPNAFGEVEGWTSLVVANADWSGCGFFNSETTDFTKLTDDHVLHFAIKDKTSTTHTITIYDGEANGKHEAAFKIGADADAYTNFTRDGEWHHIEIPLTDIKDRGIRYNVAVTGENMLAILSGGGIGKTLDIDGIFFYKPKK